MSIGPEFRTAWLTDSGIVANKVNEDSCAVCVQSQGNQEIALLLVADGVGGLGAGDKVSALVTGAVQDCFTHCAEQGTPPDGIFSALVERVAEANETVLKFAQQNDMRCGTTLTMLLLADGAYCFYHVGDSRIYHLPDGLFPQLTPLTRDHSEAIPKQTADGLVVMKTYLTNCVGYKKAFRYQQGRGVYHAGDVFVLCTDGIYKKQPDSVLQKIIRKRRNDMKAACRDLTDGAKQCGETDNLTVAAVRIITK